MPLWEPAPYKVVHGGRGKSASWSFARMMLILGEKRKLYCVCAREIQKSIEESVKKLLEDQIEALGYHEHVDPESGRLIPARYKAYDDEIRGANGTRIVFVGVRTHVRKIKSMEGIDIFWAIEATHWSKTSWEIVMPTIRRDAPYGPFGKGSELWVDFNPELATDYTYRYWVGTPPEGAIVIEASWRDNPWFPERMQKEMLKMKREDHDSYMNVYEGKVRLTLEGAIYAKQLAKAQNDGHIGPQFKIDRSKPVDVSVDLGRKDTCALLFSQQFGMEHLLGDYYGNVGFEWSHYLEEIQARRYIIRHIYLPHDGKNKVIQARHSVLRQTRDAFPGDGRVVSVKRPQSRVIPINAGRQLFPRLRINDDECGDWLIAAQHYQYEVVDDPHNSTQKKRSTEPLHNWASHPMDSYHTYCLGLNPDMIDDEEQELDEMGQEQPQSRFARPPNAQSWMNN